MYYEIYHLGALVFRGNYIIGGLRFANELMYVPSMTVTLPIVYREYMTGHDEMKVFVNGKVFWGIIQKLVENKDEETITVHLDHVIQEWTFRQISVNNAIKDSKINVIYKGSKIGSDGTTFVSANPFDITEEESESFSDAAYIARAGATAWYYTGETVSIDDVDVGERPEKDEETWKNPDEPEYENYFYVTFYAADAHVTVRATIRSGSSEIENETNEEPSVVDQLEDIYNDYNFAYEGWRMNYTNGADEQIIDYVYSRQNKLDALTKTMELTQDLFWRVRFVDERVVDISTFGDQKNYMISLKPTGVNNIRLISDLKITHDYSEVVNVATVYSDKSDSGMSSLTLREVYNDPSLQTDGFPVVILRANVNNERDYRAYSEQFPKLAPNNELEFAVIDEESVALEGGKLIEGTFAFNDIAPFTPEIDEETQEVSDGDRIKAAQTAYDAAVKRLKNARRYYTISFDVEELPADIAPGDRVRFLYDNSLYILAECSNYEKKILSYDDWFVITKITYEIDETGAEIDRVTIEKEIRIDRDIEETVW